MFHLIFSAVLSWVLTYAAGWVLWLPFSGQRKLEAGAVFFFKMGLGFIGLTVATAVYYTGGLTILIGAIPLYLAAWRFSRQKARAVYRIEAPFMVAGLAVLLITICFQLIRNQYFDPELVWLSYCDYGVYATMIEYLPKTGIEVSWPWYELFDASAAGLVQPYHYADSWYAAWVYQLPGRENALAVYIYCFIPLLVSIGFSGMLALSRLAMKRSGTLGLPELLIAFPGVFLHGCIAPAFKFFHAHSLNILTSPKIALLSIPLAMIWILWLQGQRRQAVVVAAFIPLANILYAPIVLSAFVIIVWPASAGSGRRPLGDWVILVLTAIFIIIFYCIFGNFDTSSEPVAMRGGHSYWYWFFRRMTATPVRHLLSYFPLYLVFGVLFLNRKQLHRGEWEIGISTLLLLFFGTLAAAVMNAYSEGFQFHILTYNPVSQLALVFGVSLLWRYKWQGWRPAIAAAGLQAAITFLWLFTSLHQRDSAADKQFAAQAADLLKNKNPIGVYIQNPDSITSYSADPRMCYVCNALKTFGTGYWANDIAVPENLDQLPFPERRTAIANAPFYRFLSQQKKSGQFAEYALSQLQFIDQYSVDYVLVEKGAVAPPGIAVCADTIITEPYSGAQLLILKRPCVSSSSLPPTTPR